MQSQAMRSYIACSLRLNGLNLTVTNIFSSRTLGPPGVDEGVLRILDNGVAAGVRIIFFAFTSLHCAKIKQLIIFN